MPHYCLGPQDAETKDQVWVAASSEKEARRSVALYHEPDALDPEKWFVDMTLLGRRRPGSS